MGVETETYEGVSDDEVDAVGLEDEVREGRLGEGGGGSDVDRTGARPLVMPPTPLVTPPPR